MKPFDYSKYMKNNPLLKESIGGYRDFRPMTEKLSQTTNVTSIDLDMGWDDSDPEEDKAAKAAFKKYRIKVSEIEGNHGTYKVTGTKKDILKYLKSDFYDMDQEDIEQYYPELLEKENDLEEGMYEEDDSFIQAQRDAVGAPGSSMFGDQNDEDGEYEAYDKAGELFRQAVQSLKDANMQDEEIHDLFMSILDSYEEMQGEYDAMNQDMMEDDSANGLDEYLDEAENQDKEKKEKEKKEPKQSKGDTRNSAKLKPQLNKFTGDAAKNWRSISSRVYKESRRRF